MFNPQSGHMQELTNKGMFVEQIDGSLSLSPTPSSLSLWNQFLKIV